MSGYLSHCGHDQHGTASYACRPGVVQPSPRGADGPGVERRGGGGVSGPPVSGRATGHRQPSPIRLMHEWLYSDGKRHNVRVTMRGYWWERGGGGTGNYEHPLHPISNIPVLIYLVSLIHHMVYFEKNHRMKSSILHHNRVVLRYYTCVFYKTKTFLFIIRWELRPQDE